MWAGSGCVSLGKPRKGFVLKTNKVTFAFQPSQCITETAHALAGSAVAEMGLLGAVATSVLLLLVVELGDAARLPHHNLIGWLQQHQHLHSRPATARVQHSWATWDGTKLAFADEAPDINNAGGVAGSTAPHCP
jgi:hypothetical protein